MTDFNKLIPQLGFLTDTRIKEALEAGYLIENGTWTPEQLRHASYTLRLGARVEVSRAQSAGVSPTKKFELLRLSKGERVELRPGDTALLYSMENLRFPGRVLGFTVARGLLFAEALCPENTYVDPGFSGPIYTTVTNVSSRVIHLDYGMSLARLFFFQLTEPVGDGYRTGSALGIAQQLESVTVSTLGSKEECSLATDAQLFESIRLIPIAGIHTEELLRRLRTRQATTEQRFWVLAVMWPVLLVIANSPFVRENVSGFAANVAASVVAAILVMIFPKVFALVTGR